MKYIIAEDFTGHPVPFLFPDRVTHADMREQLPYAKILSAGYVTVTDGIFVCQGSDAELNATARAEDAAIISDFFADTDAS